MIIKGIIISTIALFLMVGISIWAMPMLPAGEQFATHWDINGQADGFSGRGTVLWLMPALALGISSLLAIVPAIDPRKRNLARSALPYLVAWTGTLIVLAFAHTMMVLNAAQLIDVSNGPDMLRWLTVLLGGFFACLGAVLGKVRPNWFMGIRTPWTLSSDLSWDKTHRLVGWLFLATGLTTIITAFALTPGLAIVVLLMGTTGTALWSVFYSWWVWKNDPTRETLVPEEVE